MKKLVMLLVVLALCVPTYGYILVYKLTMSGMVVDRETIDDTEGYLLGKASGRDYLVLDVNDEDPNVLYDVRFVPYYTYTEDHTKYKGYIMWTPGEEFTCSILPGLPPKGKNIVRMELSLTGEEGFEVGWRLLGTVKSADIGTLDEDEKKEKKDVATSLKGVKWEHYENDNLADIGYWTLSLTLDTKWTKTANNPDETKGFGGIIGSFLDSESGPSEDKPKAPRGLINWLESKGYGTGQSVNGIPKFVEYDYIELAKISQISKFRSGMGHDYSDDFESCRSMKHYFHPKDDCDWGTIKIFSPVEGTVSKKFEEWAGTQIWIQSKDWPSFTFRIFHVALLVPLELGDDVSAGQQIGTHIGQQTWSDIAISMNTSQGEKLVSYFDVMTDSLFTNYQSRGMITRQDAIIPRADRDADPLTCNGETFEDAGTIENWVYLLQD
jgi:hypothetical protein